LLLITFSRAGHSPHLELHGLNPASFGKIIDVFLIKHVFFRIFSIWIFWEILTCNAELKFLKFSKLFHYLPLSIILKYWQNRFSHNYEKKNQIFRVKSNKMKIK